MTTDRPHDQLKASLVRGQLLYPDDPGYNCALRTWNLQATKRLVCTLTTFPPPKPTVHAAPSHLLCNRPEAVVSARGPGDIIMAIKSVFRVSFPSLERH
jgi:hypothetical protein